MTESKHPESTRQQGVVITRANPLAPDPRVMKIARSLRHGGYHVTLVGWNMAVDKPIFEQLEGFECHRLPVQAKFRRGMANLIHQVRWQVALFAWLRRHRKQYAIIHACDFDTVLAALWCKVFFKKKVVYDIFDFYADMLRATPRLIKRLIRWVDLRAIEAADAVILADASRTAQIRGASPKHGVVIYNALDDQQATQTPPASAESRRLVLAYFGNLQVERGLLELLEVLQRHPEWQLELGGFGGDSTLIEEKSRQLTNVSWHGLVPYEMVLEISRRADALIATYDPAIANNRYASPNKLFEAMMLGKPIIVAHGTNMDRIVKEEGCGLLVTYGSLTDLEAALTELANQPEQREQMGRNARRAYEATYNWPAMQARLLDLYTSLARGE